ncbi:MAG: amino acid permease [Desulfobacterales bacterium]|nr:amino acid permease [Desulfobacterales bacterium]
MKNRLNGNGLRREIGLFTATILVIANMVGTGIFTTTGYIMTELNNPHSLLLCWFVGGIFALCGALCYGELGSRFPRAGGEYVFLRESFGKSMGFLSGWISLIVGFSAPIAAAAIAFATYLFHALSIPASPGITLSVAGFHMATFSWVNLVAVGMIIVFSLVHYHSLATGSRVQNGLTLFKICLIIVFIITGFLFGNGSARHFVPAGGSEGISMEAFAVSLIFVAFAYSGWNAAAYLGGEIKEPRRNIPVSLVVGTLVVICLYLLLNGIYVYAMPADQMGDVLDVGAKSAVFLFGDHISRYFSGAVALGILSVLSAMIMTGPRVYFAMSKDGVFFTLFARLNKKRHTPAASIFLQAAIAIVMVVTATFNELLIYIGFTLSIIAMLTVLGMMWLRHTRPDETGAYKTLGYPFTPLLFVLGNLWIVIFSIKSRPLNALFGLTTILGGILVYAWFAFNEKRRAGMTTQEIG